MIKAYKLALLVLAFFAYFLGQAKKGEETTLLPTISETMLKKRAFTLLEMILVVIASGTLLTTIFSVLTTLPKVKVFNDARQTLIQESNDIMNRFGILFQDYTVDYEEYFNRQMMGCNNDNGSNSTSLKGKNFLRNTNENSTYCKRGTGYGNENSIQISEDDRKKHSIKYCSKHSQDGDVYNTQHCQDNTLTINHGNGEQSYGQYKALFRDVGTDTDGKAKYNHTNKKIGDADDEDLGKGPDAIRDPSNIKELYLISHDKSRRLFLRRKIRSETQNGKTITGATIQFLKLRGFDAGDNHNFENGNSTVFDGEIDTRACDYNEGFICNGTIISNTLYPDYKLPNTNDDGRVDLFSKNIDVVDFTIGITPTKDPDLARADDNAQINPYIKISLTTKLNQSKREKKLGKMLQDYTFTLQSSFDTRGFYLK